jgi:hypothetical protein
MLKICLCQRRLVLGQRMMSRAAAAEENDGDKCRKDGQGKVATLSVGQGKPPANLLTVIHNPGKAIF